MLSSSWATVTAAAVAAVPQASMTPCLFSWRGATLSLPRGPRPSRSADWAHLSSPCTEVWLQLPLDPQLHQFPSPLLPHGDALGKLTEPAPLPPSPSPTEMPRFSSRRPGPKAPWTNTPHALFLLRRAGSTTRGDLSSSERGVEVQALHTDFPSAYLGCVFYLPSLTSHSCPHQEA